MRTKYLKFAFIYLIFLNLYSGCSQESHKTSSENSATGKAGSTARFAIAGNYLYALSGGDMQLFDITTPADPKTWNKVRMNFEIETIFPYEDKLFIGSRIGVYIYDNTDPANPKYLTEFTHARSCDPVVVQGKYAYVTLRKSSACRRGLANQLDILDLTDIYQPQLVKSYTMQGPYGLGIDQEKLFICDDTAGLKVFDAQDPLKINLLQQIDSHRCRDVIPDNKLLIVTGEEGITQYNYSEIPMQLLSTIPAEEKDRGES